MKSVNELRGPRRARVQGVGRARSRLQARRRDRREQVHRLPALRTPPATTARTSASTSPGANERGATPRHAHVPGDTRRRRCRRRRRIAGRPRAVRRRARVHRLQPLRAGLPGRRAASPWKRSRTGAPETWNDRVAQGRAKIPGGYPRLNASPIPTPNPLRGRGPRSRLDEASTTRTRLASSPIANTSGNVGIRRAHRSGHGPC